MSKTLISVEEIKEKNVLRFTNDDNSQEDFEIQVKDNERIINKRNVNCVLIESQSQIDKRVETGDFSYCIFLCDAKFECKYFTEYANFKSVTFTKKACFDNATFAKDTNFWHTTFNQDVDFSNATFNQDADFKFATFIKKVNFSNAKIQGLLNFAETKVANLDLQLTTVDRIAYGDTEFSADNRETFLTLKNVALKQNDQIRALEFHQQEYQTHFDSLNWKQSDKWILGFEYWASNFGASAVVAVSRFIGVIVLFYILINGFDGNIKVIIDFILPTSYDIGSIFKDYSSNIQWYDGWLFLIYKILQLIMIYEIIKSFRKFSRQL